MNSTMNTTMGRVRPVDWVPEPSAMRPALRKRTSRSFIRVLVAFGIGISATLAWQSYGDAARDTIARRYPQLAWLAPRVPAASPGTIVPPTSSADSQDIKTMSLGLAVVRQRVDQLTASQEQITRDIAMKVQAAKQEILDRMAVLSPPSAAPPARRPAPPSTAPSR